MEKKDLQIANRLTIRYPENLSVTKRSPVEDFDIYFFEVNGIPILNLYVGNHPNLSSIEDLNSQTNNTNELKTVCRELKSKKKKFAKECLADLKKFYDFPQYLHFWYDVDTQKQKCIADEIINSLRLD